MTVADEYDELADRSGQEFPQSWIPTAGDSVIVGTFDRLDDAHTSYGPASVRRSLAANGRLVASVDERGTVLCLRAEYRSKSGSPSIPRAEQRFPERGDEHVEYFRAAVADPVRSRAAAPTRPR
jgi:hypothetical protein